jgi:asparagine synthase (glutamine-hydrolysing)
MCGIFAFLARQKKLEQKLLTQSMMTIQYRGPDDTKELWVNDKLYFAFHRLAINGLTHASDEPLDNLDCVLICNGEIYNYKTLITQYSFDMKTQNDCEVIIHLYRKFGIDKAITLLDGVFAFILYDKTTNYIYLGNDPIGIRPLFVGYKDDDYMAWASEQVALKDICNIIEFFPKGSYQEIKLDKNGDLEYILTKPYFLYSWTVQVDVSPLNLISTYRKLLTTSVEKRLMGERPIACLLSGGLDSSIIASIVAEKMHSLGRVLHTFSIGLPDAPDPFYARIVAKHIGSVHHEVIVTEKDFLDIIPTVIRAIGSYDITTVRASCGNFLIAKYIKENTDFKIIFNGDLSDELNASYKYCYYAPNDFEFFQDNIRLIQEVYKYDVIRSSRCLEHFGLEARTPFEDTALVNFVMSIPPKYKRFGPQCLYPMEKMLLRMAFVDKLPKEVCWRPKTAFSDGVSKETRSWYEIITEHIDTLVTNDEYLENISKWGEPIPFTKEAYYYQKIYHAFLGNGFNIIKPYWMPRFGPKVNDPSARLLK